MLRNAFNDLYADAHVRTHDIHYTLGRRRRCRHRLRRPFLAHYLHLYSAVFVHIFRTLISHNILGCSVRCGVRQHRHRRPELSERCVQPLLLWPIPFCCAYTARSLSLGARSHNRWPKYYYMLPHTPGTPNRARRHADNTSQAASAVGWRISPRHATRWLLLNLLSF